jgi:hypothetical protein
VKIIRWDSAASADDQLGSLCAAAVETGVVHVVFDGGGAGEPPPWRRLETWIASRAVTVADLRSSPESAVIDIALCSDLVYLRTGVELRLPRGECSAGVLWALGRAGSPALARGLLDERPITGSEAVRLGLAQRVLDNEEPLPVSDGTSVSALTVARDLMRCPPATRSALELASFRLLFASGEPREGANAFLERRSPVFDDDG